MKRISIILLALLGMIMTVYAGGKQEAAEKVSAPTVIRFLWFTDGPDKPAIEGLVAKFNQIDPTVKVEFSIVPYGELNQLLTTQAAAGQAPDIARVTEPYRFFQYTLDIRSYLKNKNFPKEFMDEPLKILTGPNGEIYGIPHDLTMNGPFVNVSLFKKAGVPLPASDKVTWEEWMKLAKEVKDKTGVPFAAACDKSGHRLDGVIQSYGGSYFTEDGKGLRIRSPETKKALEDFVRWHKEGMMPLETWAGGTGYVGANQQFINGLLVFYISGNWQIAQFQENIKDKFEWKVVPNGYIKQWGGMPGGKFLITFKSKNPEKAVQVLEFLGSKESMSEFSSKAMFLPTRKDLLETGVQYPTRNEDMNTFIKGLANLPKSAFTDNYHLRFGPVANEVRDRITQAITGELTVEKALELAEEKAKELLK
ncbi:MAG: sugar ABC transporter substrate-binding protein [Spirochaetales bacterium]|nr:sugar ABC transporter substrate-binding protein [Spirochaetales bacterium]